MWIDNNNYGNFYVGSIGFLVRSLHTNNGMETCRLNARPLRTNISGEARLSGWCGETNNISRYAEGVWKITRQNKSGTRLLISKVTGKDLEKFLEEEGYSGLL